MRLLSLITVFVLCGFALGTAALPNISLLGVGTPPSSGPSYTGPIDIVGASSGCWALRGCSASWSTGSNNGVNVRRTSDNSTSDILILSNGNLDSATGATFAGTDATASCTVAGTTATCTGASSTPHVSSVVSGVGISPYCVVAAVGTFTGGAGTMTVQLYGTTTSCGTVSVAETLTMQYGLFVTKDYDQSGSGLDRTQSTSGTQPQLFLSGDNALPAMCGNGTKEIENTTTTTINQPLTVSVVAKQIANPSSLEGDVFVMRVGSGFITFAFQDTISYFLYAGGFLTITTTNGVFHSNQVMVNNAGSATRVYVDTTLSSGGAGTNGGSAGLAGFGQAGSGSLIGCLRETIRWNSDIGNTLALSVNTNQHAYWGY